MNPMALWEQSLAGLDSTSAVLQAQQYVEAVILTSAKQCLTDELMMLEEGDVVR